MKTKLITAGETAYTPADNYIVSTPGGKILGRFEKQEDAERFMETMKRKKRS